MRSSTAASPSNASSSGLFPRRESGKIAAGYAFDADFEQPAAFIDALLRDLPVPWLAPYLNLVGGYEKLCRDGDGGAAARRRARRGAPVDSRRRRVLARHSQLPRKLRIKN